MAASMPDKIIEMENVTLAFGEGTGVFDLNLYVRPGTIFGLIGPSGCGKTTTVRLMNGLYTPDKGEVSVLGQSPRYFTSAARERIGYMPQQFVLYPNLTVDENLNFVASLYGMGLWGRRKQMRRVLDFVELRDAKHRLARNLSGGMQRRLELASALIHDPILIFADEPTAGVDPVLRGKFWDYFRALRDQGHTLFITTQYVGEAAYCDLVGVMRAGRLLYADTPDELQRRALGSEVILLAVDPSKAVQVQDLVVRNRQVKGVYPVYNQPGLMYVYVDDAAAMLPVIINQINEANITVRQAEKYTPPFDDVFVRLMEQAEAAHA